MSGRSLDHYAAPLFLAWQLTNGCDAGCLACCEESGVGRAWRDELTRDQALEVTRQIIAAGIPYVAFGGGEPLSVAHCWDIFEMLAEAGISIKLETNGYWIDEAVAARIAALGIECVQISVDGSTAAIHERMRPGARFVDAIGAIDRLKARGVAAQWVFAPSRLNIDDMGQAFDLAAAHGCSAFVTGPLMRLGRAATHWDRLACDETTWQNAVTQLRARADETQAEITLAIYPWDIVTELLVRWDSPQAMMLVVPNGKVKLLNALPFAPADLKHHDLTSAWNAYRRAWRMPAVHDFIRRCQADPSLLRHANETWPLVT
ncbi:[mycofactocin precursor peptide]-tyrosine decarboxylase/3-amino-5-[(4-hydroxyphenyl)methyl]-4,4-dimethylpyrrolidin-2-one synthase [Acidiphilium sp. MT5]